MKLTDPGKFVLAVIILVVLVGIVFSVIRFIPIGTSRSDIEPIWNDTYSLYILDPGPFETIDVENPSQKQFLILSHDGVEISCGSFPGAFFDEETGHTDLSKFATSTIKNSNWFPGCLRWQLDAAEVKIGDRDFYYLTMLMRRDHEWTSNLDYIARAVHSREIQRFPDDVDFIVRLYLTHSPDINNPAQGDIYIFTLSGTPEDVAVEERNVRRLLSTVYLDASEATLASDSR